MSPDPNQTVATERAEKLAAEAKKAATLATRAHNKELRETAKLAREAAKEAERLANWLSDTRLKAQGNVQKLYSDLISRQQEWKDDLPSFFEMDNEAIEAAARVREGQLDTEYALLNVYLDQLDAIRQMGGAFDTIGGVIQGIATGNFRSVGGKLGGLLGTIGSIDTGVWAESRFGAAGNELDKPERIGTTIAAHMEKLFRENGKFFQGLKNVLANAAIGSTAASIKAIATADNVAPIRTEADPYIQDTANSTRAMQADTANAVTLLEKIRALLEERAANDQSGFIGTTRNYA